MCFDSYHSTEMKVNLNKAGVRGLVTLDRATPKIPFVAPKHFKPHSVSCRTEVNVKLPGLDTMTPEDLKKTIDGLITDPATASAVESKKVKLGMSTDE